MSIKHRIEKLERDAPPAKPERPTWYYYLPMKGDGRDPSIGPPLGRTLSADGTMLMTIYTTDDTGRRVTRDEHGRIVPRD